MSLTIATPIRPTPVMRFLLDLLRGQGDIRRVDIRPPCTIPSDQQGWDMLDACPTILDLSSLDTAHVPHLLTDLRRMQRLHGVPPLALILVDPANVTQRRLLASSDVVGVGVATTLPRAVLPDLVQFLHTEVEIAPDECITQRPWFGLSPPTNRVFLTPACMPLLAALACAPTLRDAALWSGLSPRTMTRMIEQIQADLDIPSDRTRRTPSAWFQVMMDHLAHVGSESAS